MFITIWVANQMIGLHIVLAANAGQLTSAAAQVISLDQGGNPVTYIITQILSCTNVLGLAAVGIFYLICVVCTVIWSKKQYASMDD